MQKVGSFKHFISMNLCRRSSWEQKRKNVLNKLQEPKEDPGINREKSN
jgi:hypothetical protein